MDLDIRTLIFVLGLLHLIQVIVFYYQYATNRGFPGVKWWLLWSTAEVVGFGAMLVRTVPFMLMGAILVQNAMILLGVIFLYAGILRFLNRRENRGLLVSLFVTYLAAQVYFLVAHDHYEARGVLVSAGLAVVAFMSARALWAYSPRTIHALARFMAVTFLLHGAYHAVRVALLLSGVSAGTFFGASPMNALAFVEAIMAGTAWTYGLIIMINQRLNAEVTESKEQIELIFNTSPDAAVITRLDDGKINKLNDAFTVQSGYSREEAMGQSTIALRVWKRQGDRQVFVSRLREKGICNNFEAELLRKDGSVFWGLVSGRMTMLGGEPHSISVIRDITERKNAEEQKKRLEAQMLEDQRLASIVRLAGGVAHDFNNRLQAILGHAELMMEGVEPSDPNRADLESIRKAAQSAAELTKQLMAFARRQLMTPVVLDLNRAVGDMLAPLRSLAGPNIAVEWRPGSGLHAVRMDVSQLDQVLLHLCTNAREAMEGRGVLVLETENFECDATFCAGRVGWASGAYVRLTVRDTGPGIAAEHRVHMFEPFYSTKRTGRGLGLAAVFGVVRQNHGQIEVDSPPGQGAIFRIYLPRCEEAPVEASAPPAGALEGRLQRGRGETILIVDDEPAVLAIGQRQLQNLGYDVLAAGSAREAASLIRTHPGKIDLLLTDVIMPEMNGPELVRMVVVLRPGIRCLYMSGYTADQLASEGMLDKDTRVLLKPFTNETLAAEIRRMLDA